jgi:hypothetical protein
MCVPPSKPPAIYSTVLPVPYYFATFFMRTLAAVLLLRPTETNYKHKYN